MTSQEYAKIVQRNTPKSNTAVNCAKAFLSGGAVCGIGQAVFELLTQNGWTAATAVCMIIITVLHFPCSTTCLTVKKETGSLKWTLLSMAIPTVCGVVCCAVTSHVMRLFL